MKKSCLIILISILLISCAPVIRKDLMKTAIKNPNLTGIKEKPIIHKGELYAFGGIIVDTKITEKGSLIEAIYVPVDSGGYLKDTIPSNGRFLALYPEEFGLLDPVIYSKKRKITIAGKFIETREGKINEMKYTYPLFEIKDIYLWENRTYYYDPYYFPFYYHYPYPWRYHYRH